VWPSPEGAGRSAGNEDSEQWRQSRLPDASIAVRVAGHAHDAVTNESV
jgi:hypothetical protein